MRTAVPRGRLGPFPEVTMPDPGRADAGAERSCRRVHLPPEALDAIRRHARTSAPAECCGALIGLGAPEQEDVRAAPGSPSSPGEDVRVARVLALRNVAGSARRYEVAPEDVAAAEADAVEVGLEVVGWYHSHPSSAAIPSAADLEAAWPWYTYLLVDARTGEARAWRLAEDRSRFVEDDLRVSGGSER